MALWTILEEELAHWAGRGRHASLWWRDDDVRTASPALERLLEVGAREGVTVALAAIPAGADETLPRCLERYPAVCLMQHGYAHRNHAPAGSKAAECGAGRSPDVVVAELGEGWQRLVALLARRLLPAFVPPWNRVASEVVALLPAAGYRMLSTYRARARTEAVPGLRQVNCHVDLIDWRGGRHFIGQEKALGALVEHLRARRTGAADGDEPTGVLTHHLDHDEACWSFLEQLLRRTAHHPAVRWLGAAEALSA